MNFVGIDLHKKTISLCIVDQERKVLDRKGFYCDDPERIVAFFEEIGPFKAVVEATASYEWLVGLIEPLAERVLLAHPKKMRIIAESTRKSDKLDAQVLAEFLALDMIPQAYRPSKRQRAHRILVRQRSYTSRRLTSVRNKVRRILSNYNADRQNLFTEAGLVYLSQTTVLDADRFVLDQLVVEFRLYTQQLKEADRHLEAFAKEAPVKEAEARAILATIPQVGPVTIDVVLSELAEVSRFRSQKKACAYAGLVPGQRESAGRTREMGITKEGSGSLRWVLVQTAWRLVNSTARWGRIFEGLLKRRGKKKAIVAVARRLLCVMVSMLQSGRSYQAAMG
ncbi:MAG: IS110 family transposase [Candidatus Cloacimonetes bacterium]|nr:IS110 family transposase [Candidatus Cloacimonadota bacterium]